MKNPIFDEITRAIDGHYLLDVTDEAGERCVEPYLVFESAKGDMLLHGWQRSGAFRQNPAPQWCNLYLDDIIEVAVRRERFAKPHPGYNPRNASFYHVVFEIDGNGPRHLGAPAKPARMHRPRRRPPEVNPRAKSLRTRRGS